MAEDYNTPTLVRNLIDKGWSDSSIANKLNLSRQYVWRVRKKHALRQAQADILVEKAKEMAEEQTGQLSLSLATPEQVAQMATATVDEIQGLALGDIKATILYKNYLREMSIKAIEAGNVKMVDTIGRLMQSTTDFSTIMRNLQGDK